jgi:hypothetical protein
MKAQFVVASSREISADVVHVEPLRRTTLNPIGDLVGGCYRSRSGPRTCDLDQVCSDDLRVGSSFGITRLGVSQSQRNASDKSRDFGRPPGFGLGAPFLNRVAFPISGSKVVVTTTMWRSRVGKVKGIKV